MRVPVPVRFDEGTVSSADGLPLFWRRWLPEGTPRAAVVIVHGINEHSGRYLHVGEAFAGRELATYAFDLRGHGKSGGKRTHLNRWSDYIDDLRLFVDRARAEQVGRPLFLFAHSMGSLIALDFVLVHPQGLRGVVLEGIGLEAPSVAPAALVAVAKLMSRVWPSMALKLPPLSGGLARDPQVGKAYDADPLVGKGATARMAVEGLAATARLKTQLSKLTLPVLIVHGEKDPIALARGSEALHAAAASTDKTLRVFPGAWHELHNDLCKEEFLQTVTEWLVARA